MLDVSSQSPSWVPIVDMLVSRRRLGVGVLDSCIYAVGGAGKNESFNSVEYYDPTLNTWTRVSDMSESREGVGVGVLDGLMYDIGGYNGKDLKSVEVYRPIECANGVWSPVADINFFRFKPGVAVLDGLLYVMSGETDESIVDNVEIYNPITDTWTVETSSRSGLLIYGGVVVDRPPRYN